MIPIPLNDNIRRRSFWAVTLALILANTAVFAYELSLGPRLNRFIYLNALIPARYTTPAGWDISSLPGFVIPVLVSMFLHGGWLHLGGNMLFLFVFGRSIEDRLGHAQFLLLYFLSGYAAAALYVTLSAGSRVPSIGASGAIAGVLGAYFVTYPRARITTVIFLLFFFWTFHLPAVLVLGYWFLVQFAMGFQMLAIQSATSGGVAWWAHVGGFLCGMLLGFALRPRGRRAKLGWGAAT
ncbi:MAG: rhomboid family intramembrane serine protease [Acidobacteriota bacterium]|nr:rhomboid family intramembrane serine protease [Acidobacteriota bacterium]